MKSKIVGLIVSLLALFNLSMIPVDFEGMLLNEYQIETNRWSRIVDLQNRGEVEKDKIDNWIIRYNKTMSDSLRMVIASEIWQMSLQYSNLSIDLICGTITHESALTWNPVIVSPVGAIGLMQIMPATGSVIAGWQGHNFAVRDLFDHLINIRYGCHYLSYLIDLQGSVTKALANYNGGPYQAKYFVTGDIRLCEETRNYVPNVLKITERYGAAQ